MGHPIHLLNLRPRQVQPRTRKPVKVPTGVETTGALFLVLRRMRAPFIFVIVTFSFNVAGMMLMPGPVVDGVPQRLTLFDSFYQMAITLTTVGYSEVPYPFSYAQRMWLTLSIFMLVIAWAYAIGVLLAALRDRAFQDALSSERFRRQVRRLKEPFLLVLGYGQTGRMVALELDQQRRRIVVVEIQQRRVDSIVTDALTADVPALEGDCQNPAVLGLAGLGRDNCAGVLALTDDEDANLAAVMTVALLRPDVPVIARCFDPAVQQRMEDFAPAAVINPHDRYGGYLALLLHRPVLYQLLMWLMDNDQHQLPGLRTGLVEGRWVVCGAGEFAEQVIADLRASGLEVDQIAPTDDRPELDDAVGFVAGTDNDMLNIALAEGARLANPDAFVSVRQQDSMHRSLMMALDVDSVFIPTELVAREVLARIVHPNFWRFIEEAVQQDEAWAVRTRDRLVERCGTQVPQRDVITLSVDEAPAVTQWLESHELTIGDLLRDPDDRCRPLPLVTLLMVRNTELIMTPDDDTQLCVGDQLLLAGKNDGLVELSAALFYPTTLEYVATARVAPSTWVWRVMTQRRRAGTSVG
ncbi:NAD-binding protein [Mycobacterium neumannii]|uniref:NAD-binding protein n=1 Tax=Mycobacterium neumannii TaxID=2048551 RepID=UPI003AB44C1F